MKLALELYPVKQRKKLSASQVKRHLYRLHYLRQKTRAMKVLWEEIDQLTKLLSQQTLPKHLDINGTKQTVELKDNFSEKNVCFRPARIARFEITFGDDE